MRVQISDIRPYQSRSAPLSILKINGQARTTCFGPASLGDISRGIRTAIWGAYVDGEGKVSIGMYNGSEWYGWVEGFTLVEPITQVSLAFDFDGYPMIAFVRDNRTYGVWYRVSENQPQLFNLGVLPSRFSVISFGPTAEHPIYRGIADIVLAYGDEGNLVYRLASEAFAEQHIVEVTQTYERVWVARSGINQQGQFQLTLKG